MFKLAKLLVSVALIGVTVWFGLTVKLGDKTLFGHLRAIAASKESQDLVRGTKEKAQPIVERAGPIVDGVKRRVGSDEPAASPEPSAPPIDKLSARDRDDLRRVIGEAHRPGAPHSARP